jgi:hypothetical protein
MSIKATPSENSVQERPKIAAGYISLTFTVIKGCLTAFFIRQIKWNDKIYLFGKTMKVKRVKLSV